MKVIALYAYFAPEQAASSYLWDNTHEYFAKENIDCVVFVPTPTRGITRDIRENTPKVEQLYGNKLIIKRFPLYSEGKNPIFRAIRYSLSCIIQLYKCIFDSDAKTSNVMFVLSTPPILGATAAIAKIINHKPFIYNLQDIFPDSLVGTGLGRKDGLLWKIGRVIENFTYRHADKIIVISEDFKKNIVAKGVPASKIEVVYNWVDQNAVVNVARQNNKLFDTYGLDRSKFYVTYNGNIGLTQNLDLLLEIAKDFELISSRKLETNDINNQADQMKSDDYLNIHFVLVGDGAYKHRIEEIIQQYNLHNVHMLPFQPYEDISHVFSLGDASIVISKPGVGANSVPSKTWSIMSASRPVIASFDENELKDIIINNNCGIFAKAGDKDALKKAIIQLYLNRELAESMGQNGRKFVMENLTREYGTSRYVNIIKSVISNNV
jgi:glycosyltransferase involved in cell wall biosynthesis